VHIGGVLEGKPIASELLAEPNVVVLEKLHTVQDRAVGKIMFFSTDNAVALEGQVGVGS